MYSNKFGSTWMDTHNSHQLASLLAHEVSKIVSPAPSSPPATTIPSLRNFIQLIVRRSNTQTGTLLVSLILLTRLSCRLGRVTQGMASAPQRIFLASLIISTKLIHDTAPKNKHWLTFSDDYFELAEINLMERQFLTLMDYNLSISNTDFHQAADRYLQIQETGRCRQWQETPEAPRRNVARNANVTTLSSPSTPSSSPSVACTPPFAAFASNENQKYHDSGFDWRHSISRLSPLSLV